MSGARLTAAADTAHRTTRAGEGDHHTAGALPRGGRAPGYVRLTARRRRRGSAGQPVPEQLLALLGALAAVRLRLAEQVRDLVVPVALGVLDVGLQAQGVAQAGLGVPDEVVVLVLGAGDVA